MITVNKKHVMVHVINTNPEMMPLCLEALRKAKKPDGFQFTAEVSDTTPRGMAYHQYLNRSDAYYNFFIESDCLIIDEDFFYKMLAALEDESVGMVSVVGTRAETNENGSDFIGCFAMEGESGETKVVRGCQEGNLIVPSPLVWAVKGKLPVPNVSGAAIPGAAAMEYWRNGLRCVALPQEAPMCFFVKSDEERRQNIIRELSPIYGGAMRKLATDFIRVGRYVDIFDRERYKLGRDASGKRYMMQVGDEVTIGDDFYGELLRPIYIGHRVKIGSCVSIGIVPEGEAPREESTGIDYGAVLGDNVAVHCGVKIGRFAQILSGSVVTDDVPAYTVAAGNPARIIAVYDYRTQKYAAATDEQEAASLLEGRKEARPLVTIGVPTYNRSVFLRKCLAAIFDTIGEDPQFEVIVSDNHSEDETEDLVSGYSARYPNLTSIRNRENIGGAKNFEQVYNRARGLYVFCCGDDDYYPIGTLYKILDVVKQHQDCGIISMIPYGGKGTVVTGSGANEYLRDLTYWCTWISSLGFRSDIARNINVDCDRNLYFSQVEKQFRLLKKMPKYAVVNLAVARSDSGEAVNVLPGEYDNLDKEGKLASFGKVFIKAYIDTLRYCKRYGLSEETIKWEMKNIFEKHIVPWMGIICQKTAVYSRKDTLKYYDEYYKSEDYYLEGRKMLEERLKW